MRYAYLALCACLLLPALPGCAERPLLTDTAPGTIQKVAPGIWFRQGGMRLLKNGNPPGADGLANSIIIEMKDYLVIVDAIYPEGANMMLAEVKKLSPKPIRYVIDTHWHGDHAYGNAVYTRAGATTIAHVGAYELMQRVEPQRWKRAIGRKDLSDLHLELPQPPMLLYTTSPYVITDGVRRVELYHFRWGHTQGDTFVYLPKEKILCTGDAVSSNPIYSDPKDSDMANWANEIRDAAKLDVKYVLPGHGNAGGKELLDREADFFDALNKAVADAIHRGVTLDQVVTMKDHRVVATSFRLSQSLMDRDVLDPAIPDLSSWAQSRFPEQVRDTYLQLTQGKRYGEIDDPDRGS